MENQKNFFNRLGVYGFDSIEPLVIAALVSGDPVLLIGKGGTGAGDIPCGRGCCF